MGFLLQPLLCAALAVGLGYGVHPNAPALGRPSIAPQAAGIVAWPNFGMDPGDSGFNNVENTLSPSNVGSLQLLWEGAGQNVSAAIEDKGVLYQLFLESSANQLQALDAATGSPSWTDSGQTGLPAFGEDLVFTVCDRGFAMCAYRAKGGKLAWEDQSPQQQNYLVQNPTY